MGKSVARSAVKKLKVVARAAEPLSVRAEPVLAPRVGRIVGLSEGAWLVACGDGAALHRARTLLELSEGELRAAVERKAEALVVFEDGALDKPIVIGLLAPTASQPVRCIEAKLDGQRVVLEAADEIVLRCGAASITLRRNGRVVVRGSYVESRSRGVNRIKGGSVQIN